MKKQIYVFIVEDEKLAKELTAKFFNETQITMCQLIDASKRTEVSKALDKF